MDPICSDDDDNTEFMMSMIAESGAQHLGEEEAAGDDSNTDIYLILTSEGLEQSGDDADQQTLNGDQDENVYI